MYNVVFENVRIAYPHIFQPKPADKGDSPKKTAIILIPKDSEDLNDKLKRIKEAVKQAKTERFGNKTIKNFFTPLKDGDSEECSLDFAASHYYMNVKTYRDCFVVDRKCQHVMDPESLQSGAWVCVSLNFSGYEMNGNKGVTTYINGLQIIASGDPLGTAGSKPENIFKKWEDDGQKDDPEEVMQNPDTQKQEEEDDLDDVLGF